MGAPWPRRLGAGKTVGMGAAEGNEAGDEQPPARADPGDAEQEPQAGITRARFLVLMAGLGAGVVGAGALVHRLAEGGSILGGPDFRVLNVESAPHTPPEQWVVTVDGLVQHPLRIDYAAWQALTRVRETADFHCVEGWSVDALRWGGVAPATLLRQAGVAPQGRFVSFHAAGGTYVDSLPLAQVLDAHTMLADTLDGAPLPAEHGGPVRLVVPTQLGYKNVKWVTRLEVTAEQATGYWEERGYPADAPVG
jgi:DMSO/TMAO reductase YedYZ molybdopterin-dependent catalytic subunit